MPFIEQKYRPELDWFIKDAEEGKLGIALTGLLEQLNKISPDKYDGALNYVCTQLYRKLDTSQAEGMVVFICASLLTNFSYKAFKDVKGLLVNMIDVFAEEDIINFSVNERNEIIESLDRIYDSVNSKYIIYEIKKKEENGDLL